MNLVDSFGRLEYFADGPNADFFASSIEEIENLIVPTICILEVFKRVLQQKDEDSALKAVGGTFIQPPAKAEMLYDGSVFGNSNGATIAIGGKAEN